MRRAPTAAATEDVAAFVNRHRGAAGLTLRKVITPMTPLDFAAEYEAAATLGLVQAAVTYDPSKGSASHWAYRHAHKAILAEVRRWEYPHLTSDSFRHRRAVLAAAAENPGASHADVARSAAVRHVGAGTVRAIRELQTPVALTATSERTGGLASPDHAEDVAESEDRQRRVDVLRTELSELTPLTRMTVAAAFGLDGNEPTSEAAIARREGRTRQAINLRLRKALRTLAESPALAGLVEA